RFRPILFKCQNDLFACADHGAHYGGISNSGLLERGLQPALASAARMEVGGVGHEGLGGTVGQTGTGKMGVIECQGETGNAFYEAQGFSGLRDDGADMRFDAESNSMRTRLLETPGKFIHTAPPGI